MEHSYELRSSIRREVSIEVVPGHFATKNSHISHFVDMYKVKCQLQEAKAAARMFTDLLMGTPIESIISLDRMKMVGAYMAEMLSSGVSVSSRQNISVLSPEVTDGILILRDNVMQYVRGKRVLILTDSATTGKSVHSIADGVRYYGGYPVAIAAVFGGDFESDLPVVKLFGLKDIPTYSSYSPLNCPLCKKGVKVDAVVNSYGYSKIE
ncbi:MAG: orotate phosphoribosyltransferase [Clostridia bacterium]|nr:orotate phosphoribosyltransferase [Clostridia bacterium]